MKTLVVSDRVARRANDIISDIGFLDEMLEPTSPKEWLLRTEDENEEEMITDTIRVYFGLVGIKEDEYGICEN